MKAAGKRQGLGGDILRQETEHAGGKAEGGHRAEHIDPHQQSGQHAEFVGAEPAGEQDLAQEGNDGRDDADQERHGSARGLTSGLQELSYHPPLVIAGTLEDGLASGA
jgi:hypothetical protein